jgi:CRP-like cAMP-binding protein
MSVPVQADLRNRLLALMAAEDFALLAPHLVPVTLQKSDSLVEADEPIAYVYFLESSIGSVVATSPEGLQIEVGIFGPEGCGPLPALLGVDRSPHRVLIQAAGSAHRIARPALVAAMDRSSSLRSLLLRYVQVQIVQANLTALSNAVHPVDERLARWLLMCHDRSVGNEIAVTHEFLAIMLAVRRPSVTTALHVLEGNGFIRAERGFITVRNRRGLEEFARDAYGRPEAEYHRLIGPST